MLKNSVFAADEEISDPQAGYFFLDTRGKDNSRKFAMKRLVWLGAKIEQVSASDWHPAKNRRFRDLEFFDRIDPQLSFSLFLFTGSILAILAQS